MFISKVYGHTINPNQNLNKSDPSFGISYQFEKKSFGRYVKTKFGQCQHPSSRGSIGEVLLDLKTRLTKGDIVRREIPTKLTEVKVINPENPTEVKGLINIETPKGKPCCSTFVSQSTGEKVRIIPFPSDDKILVWQKGGKGFLIQQSDVVNKGLFKEVDDMLSLGRERSSADF